MGIFKIFYSWQSDLPGSKTRNFIRECIDEAIDLAQESAAVEAERDEATIGTTGSPNIVTTLLSKINDCDLFVADLSLCFIENQKKEKKSPNPNVLFELGYAVKPWGGSALFASVIQIMETNILSISLIIGLLLSHWRARARRKLRVI